MSKSKGGGKGGWLDYLRAWEANSASWNRPVGRGKQKKGRDLNELCGVIRMTRVVKKESRSIYLEENRWLIAKCPQCQWSGRHCLWESLRISSAAPYQRSSLLLTMLILILGYGPLTANQLQLIPTAAHWCTWLPNQTLDATNPLYIPDTV